MLAMVHVHETIVAMAENTKPEKFGCWGIRVRDENGWSVAWLSHLAAWAIHPASGHSIAPIFRF